VTGIAARFWKTRGKRAAFAAHIPAPAHTGQEASAEYFDDFFLVTCPNAAVRQQCTVGQARRYFRWHPKILKGRSPFS